MCKVYEVDYLEYYHYRIDSPINDDYVCHNCMARQYRANNCKKPTPPHHNQQESISLEDINRNMQAYFTHEWNITVACHRGLIGLQESMSNLETKIKNQKSPFSHIQSQQDL